MNSQFVAILIVGALSTLGFVAPTGHDDVPTELSWNPLPFDPLTNSEQTEAVRIVRSDVRIQLALTHHHEVIGASVYTDKAFGNLPVWPRMAEVWIYDYTSNLALHALADLQVGAITQFTWRPVQPPLTSAEIDRAARTALDSEDVQDLLSHQGIDVDAVDWTARLWSGDLCPLARCALVGFVAEGKFVADWFVLVELNAARIVDIIAQDGHKAVHS